MLAGKRIQHIQVALAITGADIVIAGGEYDNPATISPFGDDGLAEGKSHILILCGTKHPECFGRGGIGDIERIVLATTTGETTDQDGAPGGFVAGRSGRSGADVAGDR